MDLVEKNIALTQEHKVLEALMKLRTVSSMTKTGSLKRILFGLYVSYKNLEIQKSKESTKESQRLEALKLGWVSKTSVNFDSNIIPVLS